MRIGPGSSGPIADWLSALTQQELRATFTPAVFNRGWDDFFRGRVQSLTAVTGAERSLSGVVDDEERGPVTTLVSAYPVGPRWSVQGSCECGDPLLCRHAAAVILAGQDRVREHVASGAMGDPFVTMEPWELAVQQLLEDVAAPSTPLAIQFLPQSSGRIALRPTRPTRSGWVKAGARWEEVLADGRYLPAQQRALASVWSACATGPLDSSSPVEIGTAGPGLWPALAEAVNSGVTLLFEGGPVQVRTVRVTTQLRPDPAGYQLAPRLMDDDGAATPMSDAVLLIGAVPHGAAYRSGATLVLGRFDPAPDPSVQELLTTPLTIPTAGVERFVEVYAPVLSRRVPVDLDQVELPDQTPARPRLELSHGSGHVLELVWLLSTRVAGRRVSLPLREDTGGVSRDAAAEQSLEQRVLSALPAATVEQLAEGEPARLRSHLRLHGLAAARFSSEVLPVLRGLPEVEVVEHGAVPRYREAQQAPRIEMGTTETDDRDWFDLHVQVLVDGESAPLDRVFTALARGEEGVVLDSGLYFRLDHPELASLRELIEEARSMQEPGSKQLRLSVLQAGLWSELETLGVVTQQSARWRSAVHGLLHAQDVEPATTPVGLKAELRPYQHSGFAWLSLLWDLQLGGILADDMGLGKTLQSLALFQRAKERGTLTAPILVVAPTSVLDTWVREAARFTPDLRVTLVNQTDRRREQDLADVIGGADLVVTSYALFRIDARSYQSISWGGLILDEAQFVKNHQAKTYQVARRLDAGFKLAITGTPLENSVMDLWSLLSIVAPGLFPDPDAFTEQFRRPIEVERDSERLELLRRRVRPLLLRRTKEEVAKELPPKIEQVLTVELSQEHRRAYDRHLQRERGRVLGLIGNLGHNRIEVLAALTRLRQLALAPSLVDPELAGVESAKIETLISHVRELAQEGHRALVFSQFTSFLAIIRKRLEAEGIDYCYLDGRTRDRTAQVDRFRTGVAPVFLISLKAGGFGLTLTEADYVFVMDPWWNPAAENQAIDRTHRIGQDKPVNVYRLVSGNTIEEKVVALQERKRDLFKSVVDDGAISGGSLTPEDIRALLAD